MTKRILSLVMVLCMLLSAASVSFAEGHADCAVAGATYLDSKTHNTFCADGASIRIENHTFVTENGKHYCSVCQTAEDAVACTLNKVTATGNQNAEEHWQTCSLCGVKANVAEHTMGEWDLDETKSTRECTVCKYTLAECTHPTYKWIKLTNNPSQCDTFCATCGKWLDKVDGKNIGPKAHVMKAVEGSCTATVCENCGEPGTVAEGTSNCGKVTKVIICDENGKETADGEYHATVCANCGKVLNNGPFKHNDTPSDVTVTHANGVHTYSCKGCGATWTKTCVELNSNIKWTRANDTQCKFTCKVDVKTADETYLIQKAHTVYKNHNLTAATCEAQAYCLDCGAKVGALADHVPGEATCADDAVCVNCNVFVFEGTATGKHVGGKATCATQAICDTCGEPYGELEACVFEDELTVDGEYHYFKCTNKACTEIKGKELHVYTGKGECVCGAKNELDCNKLGLSHHWVTVVGKDAICEVEDGYTDEKYCDQCGTFALVSEPISKEHKWDKGVVEIPATCKQPGKRVLTCERCDKKMTEAIPTTEESAHVGFEFVKVTKKAACGVKGEELWKCTNCGYELKKETAALEHALDTIVCADETCDLDKVVNCVNGIWSFTGCTREGCGYIVAGSIKQKAESAGEHDFDTKKIIEGSCMFEGETVSYQECDNEYCEVIRYVKADGTVVKEKDYEYHDAEAVTEVIVEPATCYAKGIKKWVCSKCGEQVYKTKKGYVTSTKTEDIPQLTHTNAKDPVCKGKTKDHEVDGWLYTAPTCKDFGYWESYCGNCNANYKKVLDTKHLGDHKLVDGEYLGTPVCGEPYKLEQVCKYCGEVIEGEYKTGDKLECNWVADGEPTKAPTCTKAGEGWLVCTRCGETKYGKIPATNDHEYAYTYKAPDCVNPSMHGWFCVKCGEAKGEPNKDFNEPKLGHDWDNGTIVKMCGYSHVAKYECQREGCGVVKYVDLATQDNITKLVENDELHTFVEKDIQKHSCTTDGLVMTKVCEDCGYVSKSSKNVFTPASHTVEAGTTETYKDCTGTYTKYTCSVCKLDIVTKKSNTKYTGAELEKLENHKEGAIAYDLITPYTCTENGFGTAYCTACGWRAAKPATISYRHTWSTEATVVVAPTCGKDGYGVKHCTVCGEEKLNAAGQPDTVTLLATGKHNFHKEILDAGSCELTSYIIWVCDGCDLLDKEANVKKAGWENGYYDSFKMPYINDAGELAEKEVKHAVEKVPNAGGHDWTAYSYREADCIFKEGMRRTCKKCGIEQHLNGEKGKKPLTERHDWIDPIVVKPTCYIAGSKTVYCAVCGALNYEEPIEKLEHVWQADTTDPRNKKSTCTTKGIEVLECKNCKAEKLNPLPYDMFNHEYETLFVLEAMDCAKNKAGLEVQKCKKCDDKQAVNYVPVTHTWDAGVVVKEANCVEEGILKQTCTVCAKATREVPIVRVAHKKVTVEQAADCYKAAGIVTKCSVCDQEFDFVKTGVKALGHKLSDQYFVAATCTSAGGYQKKCLREGCTYTEFTADAKNFPALNHAGATKVSTTAATCISKGYETWLCPICKVEFTKNEVAKDSTKHNWEIIAEHTEGITCAKGGYVDRKCTLCGETQLNRWHQPECTMSDYVYTKDYVYRFCKVCGEIESIWVSDSFENFDGCTVIKLDKNNKPYLDGAHKGLVIKAGKPGSCEEAGQIEHIECTVCGTIIQQGAEIPAHNVTVIEAKAATCTAEGNTAGKYCETCKEYIVKPETIAKVAHTPVEVPAVEATATTAGATAGKKCSVCGEILEGCEPIAKLGATVKRLCVVRSKAADYREDNTSVVVKMLNEGTAVVITGELVNEYYPVEGGYIHMSYITVA